jgi:hypothetical protein
VEDPAVGEDPTVWGYMSFGRVLQTLITVQPGQARPVETIATLLNEWKQHDPQCVAFAIYKRVSSLLQDWQDDSEAPLSHEEADDLRLEAYRLDAVLEREMARIAVYPLPKDRHVSRLLHEDDVKAQLTGMMSRKVVATYSNLPREVQLDLVEASQCLNFRLPVGAAMLALRAAEAVLKRYYTVIGAPPPDERRPTFGTFTRRLKDWNDPRKPPDELVSFVDNLVKLRNSVMHLADRNDLPKAEAYYRDCLLAIREIVIDLKRREEKLPEEERDLERRFAGPDAGLEM